MGGERNFGRNLEKSGGKYNAGDGHRHVGGKELVGRERRKKSAQCRVFQNSLEIRIQTTKRIAYVKKVEIIRIEIVEAEI